MLLTNEKKYVKGGMSVTLSKEGEEKNEWSMIMILQVSLKLMNSKVFFFSPSLFFSFELHAHTPTPPYKPVTMF